MRAKIPSAKDQTRIASRTSLFEEASNLCSILSDPSILVVDCHSFAEYSQSHILHAVNIDLMQFHWIDTSASGIRGFNAQAIRLLSNLGVTDGKKVIFYDNVSGSAAARGVWLLLYFSHQNVSILDGGFDRWKKLGYTVERTTNPFKPARFRGRPDRRLLTTKADLTRIIKDKTGVVIDARSALEYSGKVVRAARAGHIPGALNIEWTRNLSGGSFKHLDKLRRL